LRSSLIRSDLSMGRIIDDIDPHRVALAKSDK
jgi:hypothetical protein